MHKKKGALRLKGSLCFKLPFFLYFRTLRDSAGSDDQDDDGDDQYSTNDDYNPEQVSRDCLSRGSLRNDQTGNGRLYCRHRRLGLGDSYISLCNGHWRSDGSGCHCRSSSERVDLPSTVSSNTTRSIHRY